MITGWCNQDDGGGKSEVLVRVERPLQPNTLILRGLHLQLIQQRPGGIAAHGRRPGDLQAGGAGGCQPGGVNAIWSWAGERKRYWGGWIRAEKSPMYCSICRRAGILLKAENLLVWDGRAGSHGALAWLPALGTRTRVSRQRAGTCRPRLCLQPGDFKCSSLLLDSFQRTWPSSQVCSLGKLHLLPI